VSYGNFNALIVKAIKEQQQMIEALKKQNEELEIRLRKLEKRENEY
jgi:cell shape-determining protein MreC